MGKRTQQSKTPECPEYLQILQHQHGRNVKHKKKSDRIKKCTISIEDAELERVLSLLLCSAETYATIAIKLEITRSEAENDTSQDFLP